MKLSDAVLFKPGQVVRFAPRDGKHVTLRVQRAQSYVDEVLFVNNEYVITSINLEGYSGRQFMKTVPEDSTSFDESISTVFFSLEGFDDLIYFRDVALPFVYSRYVQKLQAGSEVGDSFVKKVVPARRRKRHLRVLEDIEQGYFPPSEYLSALTFATSSSNIFDLSLDDYKQYLSLEVEVSQREVQRVDSKGKSSGRPFFFGSLEELVSRRDYFVMTNEFVGFAQKQGLRTYGEVINHLERGLLPQAAIEYAMDEGFLLKKEFLDASFVGYGNLFSEEKE